MKKIALIIGILLILITGGYLFIRYKFLKSKDFHPNEAKASTPLDLRPSIIAKLQQLVKDGSSGLYKLSIDQIDPDVLGSKITIHNVELLPDTLIMHQLDHSKELADDVYKIFIKTVHIDGLGVDQFLHKDKVDIKSISITEPIIHLYHSPKPYNESTRKKNDTISLYHRLMKQMKRIAVQEIIVRKGKFFDHDLNKGNGIKKFNDVDISIKDLLIDSSTQFNQDRFLFARKLNLSAKDYAIITPDSLYDISIGQLAVSADQHSVTASRVSLKPHGGNEAFQKNQVVRKEMFTGNFPRIVLTGTNWMSIMHRQTFKANSADITGGSLAIYLDKTLPTSKIIKTANFPDQALMKFKVPVSLSSASINHLNLTYEEYDPKIQKSGKAYFDNVKATIRNITNMASVIKRTPITQLSGTTMFMHHIKMNAGFSFDLAKIKTGVFTAYVHMDSLKGEEINAVTEPMSYFKFKSGAMSEATAHVSGDNFNAKGDVLLLYKDLKIIPLKSKEDEGGNLKKKHLTSLIANAILIKNNNPTGNQAPRHPEYSSVRGYHGNFFNFVWTTILTGILKSIGIPSKFVVK